MTERGRLITIEGGEGVGKSTNLERVAGYLEERGLPVYRTREPGGTRLAEGVRELLKDPEIPVTAGAELLLIFAARASHLEEELRPRFDRGEWVVCDRFTDATYVYQGIARQLGEAPVSWLEEWVQQDLRPDLTILLDAPVAVGFERADGRGGRDRFERENVDFFEQVRAGYLERARAEPERFRVIAADRSPEEVASQLYDVLKDWLETAG